MLKNNKNQTQKFIQQTKKNWKNINNNSLLKNQYGKHIFDPIYFLDEGILTNSFNQNFYWNMHVEIEIKTEKQANIDALKALHLGAESICFTKYKKHNLNVILEKIQIEIIRVEFKDFENFEDLAKKYIEIAVSKLGENGLKQLNGCFYITNISESSYNYFSSKLPNYHFNTINLNGTKTVNFLKQIQQQKKTKNKRELLNKTTYTFNVSSNFLFEIARIRSFQIKYQKITGFIPYILCICESQSEEKDALIKNSIKAISSIIAGCSGLLIKSDKNPILNMQQQLILKKEGMLNQVYDPLHGSYYIEKITNKIDGELKINTSLKDNLKNKTWDTIEGITLKNKYYKNDTTNTPHLKYGAGIPPYIRGPYASMYCERKWTIRQYAGYSTAEESNKFYRKNLKAGQTGLSIAFDLPTHRGYDSNHERVFGDVGKAGVAIDTIDDMEVLFHKIDLKNISVSMTMNGAVIPILAFFIAIAEKKGVSKKDLQGTIQNDILKEFMVRNTYIYPPKKSMRIIRDIFKFTSKNMPKFNSISVSGYHMLEAGASADIELAYTLCDGLEYVRNGIKSGLKIDEFAPRLSFFWGIGMNFFMEIAKMRAARILWAEMMAPFNPKNPKSLMLRSHCQTSGWSLTKQTPENNITRTTLEALAAVIGGTQSLHTNALDEAIALPTNESAKIARDTQLFLQNETDICNAIDPFGGSYYLEHLTNELKEKAKKHIYEIEEIGGMVKAIELGVPKLRIESSAIKRQSQIDSGENLIIGVNCYQQNEKSQIKILEIDNKKVQKNQIKRLNNIKKNRNNSKIEIILNKISEACNDESKNLLELAIEAAKAKATIGEISHAMEKKFSRYTAKTIINSGVYKMENMNNKKFVKAQSLTELFDKKYGRRPRILAAKIGQDGHDRGIKIIATSFSDIGFDVDIAPLFQTPKEIAKQAIENDTHLIGISSLAGGHKTLIPALIKELEKYNRQDIMIIAGGVIPEQDYEYLFKKGVKKIFGSGTIVIDAAIQILNELLEK